jgi:hypothetical protein
MASRARKGWISPANLALTPQSFRFPQETVDELTAAATASGLSKRQVVKEAIHEYAVARGIKVRRRRRRAPEPG